MNLNLPQARYYSFVNHWVWACLFCEQLVWVLVYQQYFQIQKKKNLNFLFWACFWNSNHYKNLFRVSAFLVRIIADMMVAPPRNLGPSFRHLTCAPTPRVSVCVLLWPSEDGLGAWSCHVHSEGGKCLGVYFCWCGQARTQWLTVLPVNTEKGREELSGPFWEMTTPETLSLGTN